MQHGLLDAEIAFSHSGADTNAGEYGIEIKLKKGESYPPFFYRAITTVKSGNVIINQQGH